jgi:8-amino-7-oxononanoate synthase
VSPSRDWIAWAEREGETIRAAGQWRAPRELDAAGPAGVLADGSAVVSFASNDYLGLTQHPAVTAAAHAAIDRWGAGAGAARLIVGSRPVHHELELELAGWKETQAAALFTTGYAANLGVLSTFAQTGALIVSDELNHASIIDGARLARADVGVYRHADVDHATALIDSASGPTIIVTDRVFSMDGDVAPVGELMKLAANTGSLLVLDEAHAVLEPEDGLDPSVIRVGTLSKTLGALGGFVAGPEPLIDLLVNRARPYIFTTASSPADAAAALAAVRIVRSARGDALRQRLRAVIDRVVPAHPSPIIPIIIGDEAAALAASQRLLALGLLVPAIRPPTVAPGTSRLRIALSAAHTDGQLAALVDGLGATIPDWRSRA